MSKIDTFRHVSWPISVGSHSCWPKLVRWVTRDAGALVNGLGLTYPQWTQTWVAESAEIGCFGCFQPKNVFFSLESIRAVFGPNKHLRSESGRCTYVCDGVRSRLLRYLMSARVNFVPKKVLFRTLSECLPSPSKILIGWLRTEVPILCGLSELAGVATEGKRVKGKSQILKELQYQESPDRQNRQKLTKIANFRPNTWFYWASSVFPCSWDSGERFFWVGVSFWQRSKIYPKFSVLAENSCFFGFLAISWRILQISDWFLLQLFGYSVLQLWNTRESQNKAKMNQNTSG